jgi:hypothetical protein
MTMKTARCLAAVMSALLLATSDARAQLFEADSKRFGNPKMDIVVKEVERRERASVIDIKINAPGSSVGSSFFILCSIRQLAQIRGNYRYIVKLDDQPKRRMLVGFLRRRDEAPAELGPEFQAFDSREDVIDLDQYAEICASSMK